LRRTVQPWQLGYSCRLSIGRAIKPIVIAGDPTTWFVCSFPTETALHRRRAVPWRRSSCLKTNETGQEGIHRAVHPKRDLLHRHQSYRWSNPRAPLRSPTRLTMMDNRTSRKVRHQVDRLKSLAFLLSKVSVSCMTILLSHCVSFELTRISLRRALGS
jgi:hypothetical protein